MSRKGLPPGWPEHARRRAPAAAAALVASFVAFSSGRSLAEPTTAERAIAERLYDRARGQMEAGRLGSACDSFAESQRLDPGTGTKLNLAACHEANGKLASAWIEFREAVAALRREGRPDRLRYALDRLAVIEPRLAYLTLVVPEAAHGQAPTVTLDGLILGPPAWGVAIPVDAGWHETIAEYERGGPWHATIKMRDGQRRELAVPSHVAAAGLTMVEQDDSTNFPMQKPSAPRADLVEGTNRSPRRELSRGDTTRIAGLALAGVSVAALGVGGYFAWHASTLWRGRNAACPMEACSPEGINLGARADTSATVATWAIVGGAATLGTATLILLLQRSGAPVEVQKRETFSWARSLRNVRVDGPARLSVGGTF